MSEVDLFDAPEAPAKLPRRLLTVVVGIAGVMVGTPVLTFAAVKGFAQGWRSGPWLALQGENIVQPLVFLLSGVIGALLYALVAFAAMSLVVLAAFAVRRRSLKARRPTG
jgi:hypothetical protein